MKGDGLRRAEAEGGGILIRVDAEVHAAVARRAGFLQQQFGRPVGMNEALRDALGLPEGPGSGPATILTREERLDAAGRAVARHLENFYREHLPGCAAAGEPAEGTQGAACDCGMDALRDALGQDPLEQFNREDR